MTNYDPSRLDPVRFFTDEELKKLHVLASEYPLSELFEISRILEERSIDYAYVSSKIEGNAYSKKGAAFLLEYGFTEGGKLVSDALMLLDLHAAFLYVMTNAGGKDVCSKDFVKDLHAKTTARELKDKYRGTARSVSSEVTGSSCKPLATPAQLDSEFDYLLSVLKTITDPFEQAVYAHCNLAYLRYFAAGNKRTARLMQAAVLVHHGITPVLMRSEDIAGYLSAVIGYCETGDRRQYAQLFLSTYQHTIDHLLVRSPEQLEAIAEDEKRLQEAWEKRRARQLGKEAAS